MSYYFVLMLPQNGNLLFTFISSSMYNTFVFLSFLLLRPLHKFGLSTSHLFFIFVYYLFLYFHGGGRGRKNLRNQPKNVGSKDQSPKVNPRLFSSWIIIPLDSISSSSSAQIMRNSLRRETKVEQVLSFIGFVVTWSIKAAVNMLTTIPYDQDTVSLTFIMWSQWEFCMCHWG